MSQGRGIQEGRKDRSRPVKLDSKNIKSIALASTVTIDIIPTVIHSFLASSYLGLKRTSPKHKPPHRKYCNHLIINPKKSPNNHHSLFHKTPPQTSNHVIKQRDIPPRHPIHPLLRPRHRPRLHGPQSQRNSNVLPLPSKPNLLHPGHHNHRVHPCRSRKRHTTPSTKTHQGRGGCGY